MEMEKKVNFWNSLHPVSAIDFAAGVVIIMALGILLLSQWAVEGPKRMIPMAIIIVAFGIIFYLRKGIRNFLKASREAGDEDVEITG